MKSKQLTPKIQLPKGFTVKPGLDEEYANQPLFKEKVAKANHILKTFGLPKTKFG